MSNDSTAPSQALLNMRMLENIKVPKRTQSKNGLEVCSVQSKEFQDELLPILLRSFRLSDSQQRLEFTEACYIHTARIQETFAQKRMEMKRLNVASRNLGGFPFDFREYFAFLPVRTMKEVEQVATLGVANGNLKSCRLGASDSGVSLSQCADITNTGEDGYFTRRQGWLVLCKYIRGRVNHVVFQEPETSYSGEANSDVILANDNEMLTDLNSSTDWLTVEPSDPAPEYDCHLASRFPHMKPLVDGPMLAFHLSQVYIFDYNEDFDIQTYPRQILPYAAVAYRSIKPQRMLPLRKGLLSSGRLSKSTPQPEANSLMNSSSERNSKEGTSGNGQAHAEVDLNKSPSEKEEEDIRNREREMAFIQELLRDSGDFQCRQPLSHSSRSQLGVGRSLPSVGRYIPLGVVELILPTGAQFNHRIASVELRSFHHEFICHPLLCQPRLELEGFIPWDILSVYLLRGTSLDRLGRPQHVIHEQRELMLPSSFRRLERIRMRHIMEKMSDAKQGDNSDVSKAATKSKVMMNLRRRPVTPPTSDEEDNEITNEEKNAEEDNSSTVEIEDSREKNHLEAISKAYSRAMFVSYYNVQCVDVSNSRGVMSRFIAYLNQQKLAAKINFRVATDTLALLLPDCKFAHSLGLPSGECVDVNYLHMILISRGSVLNLRHNHHEGNPTNDVFEEETQRFHRELQLWRKGVRQGRIPHISYDDPQMFVRLSQIASTLVHKQALGDEMGLLTQRRFCHLLREQERIQKSSLFQELRRSTSNTQSTDKGISQSDTPLTSLSFKVYADEQKLLALQRGEKLPSPPPEPREEVPVDLDDDMDLSISDKEALEENVVSKETENKDENTEDASQNGSPSVKELDSLVELPSLIVVEEENKDSTVEDVQSTPSKTGLSPSLKPTRNSSPSPQTILSTPVNRVNPSKKGLLPLPLPKVSNSTDDELPYEPGSLYILSPRKRSKIGSLTAPPSRKSDQNEHPSSSTSRVPLLNFPGVKDTSKTAPSIPLQNPVNTDQQERTSTSTPERTPLLTSPLLPDVSKTPLLSVPANNESTERTNSNTSRGPLLTSPIVNNPTSICSITNSSSIISTSSSASLVSTSTTATSSTPSVGLLPRPESLSKKPIERETSKDIDMRFNSSSSIFNDFPFPLLAGKDQDMRCMRKSADGKSDEQTEDVVTVLALKDYTTHTNSTNFSGDPRQHDDSIEMAFGRNEKSTPLIRSYVPSFYKETTSENRLGSEKANGDERAKDSPRGEKTLQGSSGLVYDSNRPDAAQIHRSLNAPRCMRQGPPNLHPQSCRTLLIRNPRAILQEPFKRYGTSPNMAPPPLRSLAPPTYTPPQNLRTMSSLPNSRIYQDPNNLSTSNYQGFITPTQLGFTSINRGPLYSRPLMRPRTNNVFPRR